MRSLYLSVLLAMSGTLSLSLLVFIAISDHVEVKYLYPVFESMDELQLRQARENLESKGSAAAARYLKQLDELFGSSHYLVDARGRDTVSGADRSALLPASPIRKSRGYRKERLVITHKSMDDRYWFVVVDPREPNRWTFFPYYLLVLGVAGSLAWLAAVGVISPIRNITAMLDHFGAGHLNARVETRRKDEVGGLARSFNGMAERLQTSIQSERRLLEDISHELRSPLARLTFAVRLAKTAPDHQTALDRVQKQVNRITSLVSEIMELTRVEGDPLARKTEAVVLMDVVRETVADCQVEADARTCRIEVEGQITSEISGDGELLRRAIENVLRNAIRYSPEGAAIPVVLSESGGDITVTIRDYGPGVPERSLQHIFDPFFRVAEARETETGGVGLGLSIARRALLVHGGTIGAHNADPGLRVEIGIPLRRNS